MRVNIDEPPGSAREAARPIAQMSRRAVMALNTLIYFDGYGAGLGQSPR
jgi:hypothetical protein